MHKPVEVKKNLSVSNKCIEQKLIECTLARVMQLFIVGCMMLWKNYWHVNNHVDKKFIYDNQTKYWLCKKNGDCQVWYKKMKLTADCCFQQSFVILTFYTLGIYESKTWNVRQVHDNTDLFFYTYTVLKVLWLPVFYPIPPKNVLQYSKHS